MSTINVNAIDKESGSTLTLGGSGTTVAVHASATTSGFGSPAYASNASATDDTVNVDASNNLQFNSGYGSTVTAFGVRAWVNFNGSGTVAIRASGNVSSITDNGTGDYTINFTTSMPDVNYAVVGSTGESTITFGYTAGPLLASETFATGSIRLATGYSYAAAGYFGAIDWAQSCIGIIR